MAIALFGLNFRSAPLALRGRLTLTGHDLHAALTALHALNAPVGPVNGGPLLHEVAILSTCNRIEVVVVTDSASEAVVQIGDFLAAIGALPLADLMAHAYVHTDEDAVRHLMRVACGADSMILGEGQILGQVARAYEEAHAAGTTGALLSRLFAHATHAGKRARSESAISRHATSASHAAVVRLLSELDDPAAAELLIVGAGETARLAAQLLQRQGVAALTFVNRTLEHAEALALEFGGRARTWYALDEALLRCDAALCATGAPHTVLSHADVACLLAQRDGRPLVLVDLAVPRDVEESVRSLAGVRYFDIDDMQSVVDANLDLRRQSLPQIEEIIRQEQRRYAEWVQGRQVLPVIRTLRDWAQSLAREELEQTLSRLPAADERTRRLMARLVEQLVNRLLHEPTTRLRMQAMEGHGHGYAHAVRELFALDELEPQPCICAQQGNECAGHALHPAALQQRTAGAECSLQCILPSSPAAPAPERAQGALGAHPDWM